MGDGERLGYLWARWAISSHFMTLMQKDKTTTNNWLSSISGHLFSFLFTAHSPALRQPKHCYRHLQSDKSKPQNKIQSLFCSFIQHRLPAPEFMRSAHRQTGVQPRSRLSSDREACSFPSTSCRHFLFTS